MTTKETKQKTVAQEMFEKLDFTREQKKLNITYTHRSGIKVVFNVLGDGYILSIPPKNQHTGNEDVRMGIGTKIHKAIHQQLIELGNVNE